MYTLNIRHIFNLSVTQIVLIVICFCFAQNVDAQRAKGNYNFLSFEQKPYYFGITLGYNSSDFKIFKSDQFLTNDSISIVEDVNGPGFNLGIVTNLKIGDYFDFRFLPTLSFAEKNIKYADNTEFSVPRTRKIEQVLVQMPFHIRYKSAPYNDFRLFVIAGVKYDFDVASESRTRQADELVKIASSDFSAEIGAGIQFFFPYFIFSPEFKITQGISNVLIFDDQLDESNVLEKVLARTFTLSLHFEG